MTAPAPPEHTTHPRSVKGRPHLGPREIITAALWPSLEALVDTARGSLDRSPYLADLLAWHVGRPDLIRHAQLTMEFATGQTAGSDETPEAKTRHCTVRVHPAVADETRQARNRIRPPASGLHRRCHRRGSRRPPGAAPKQRGCRWRCDDLLPGRADPGELLVHLHRRLSSR